MDSQAFAALLQARKSVRDFLPESVPEQTLQKVFAAAQMAPSNCNTQPWLVHVASNEKRDELAQALQGKLMQGEFQMDFPYEGKYQGVYKERQVSAAVKLYQAMGIAKDDKPARDAAFFRNFEFFGAPHVAFIFMPEAFLLREAADCGMYVQNLLLSMVSHGLAACPQTALSFHADCVREVLTVAPDQKLLLGISFGFENKASRVNQIQTEKAQLNETVTFHG